MKETQREEIDLRQPAVDWWLLFNAQLPQNPRSENNDFIVCYMLQVDGKKEKINREGVGGKLFLIFKKRERREGEM